MTISDVYEPGDKIFVPSNIVEIYERAGGPGWCNDMFDYVGTWITLKAQRTDSWWTIEEDDGRWDWWPDGHTLYKARREIATITTLGEWDLL